MNTSDYPPLTLRNMRDKKAKDIASLEAGIYAIHRRSEGDITAEYIEIWRRELAELDRLIAEWEPQNAPRA